MLRHSLCAALLCLCLPVVSLSQIDRARDDFNLAAGMHDRGFYDRAVGAFENFLRDHPKDRRVPKARFYLGQSLVELGRDAKALPHFDAYLKSGQKELRDASTFRRGEILQRLGRNAEAMKALRPLTRRGKPELREPALYFYGEAAVAEGKHDEAAQAWGTLLQQFGGGAYAGYAASGTGFLRFEAQEFDEALALFKRAAGAQGDPELVAEARVMQGECLLRLERWKDAFAMFDAVKSPSFDAQVRLGRARAQLGLGQVDAAVASFRDFSQRHPDDGRGAGALIRAAARLHERGASDKGMELLGLVRNATGQDAEDLAYWRGVLQAKSGNLEESIVSLRAALEREGTARRRFTLADTLSRAQQYDEAAQLFAQVRKQAGDDPSLRAEATFAEAFARNRLGQFDQAARLLEQLTKMPASDELRQDGWFALGENLFALKQYQKAHGWYGRVAQKPKSPNHADALYKKGWCEYLLKHHDEAIATLEAFVKVTGQAQMRAEARYLIGKSHEAAGRHAAARKVFASLGSEKATGGADLGGRALLGAAVAARRENNLKAALDAYTRVLESDPDEELLGEALAGMGDVLFNAGQSKEAEQVYGRMLELVPNHARANDCRLGRAWSLRDLDRHDESVAEAQVLVERAGDDAELLGEALYLEGLGHSSKERHAEAVACLDRMVKQCPDHERSAEAGLLLGVSLARKGDTGRAEKALLAYVKSGAKKGRSTALYELGFCFEAREATADRDRVFATLLKEDPGSEFVPDVLFRLAESDYAAERWEPALKRYAQLVEHEAVGDLADKASYKAGWCERRRERHAPAATWFRKVAKMEKSPLAAESCWLAADEFEKHEKLDEAVIWFTRMVEKHSDHELAVEAEFRRLLACAALEDHDTVIRDAAAVIGRYPKHDLVVRLRSALGDSFYAKKAWGRARKAFRAVTDSTETVLAARAHYRIGHTFMQEGQDDRAIDELLKVTILFDYPEWGAKATLVSAELLKKKGKNAKALRLFQELQRDYPSTAEAKAAARHIRELENAKEER